MDAFAELPDALVQDLLAKAVPVAERVNHDLQSLRKAKAAMRGEAERRGWIRRKADLDVPREPSVVGIDGSYQVHRLTAVDLCAAGPWQLKEPPRKLSVTGKSRIIACGSSVWGTARTSPIRCAA